MSEVREIQGTLEEIIRILKTVESNISSLHLRVARLEQETKQ